MEVISSVRHPPPNWYGPFKRSRSFPSFSHFEDPTKLTLEDGKEYNFKDVECTTLLKFVPYDCIEKDDQKEIDAIRAFYTEENDLHQKAGGMHPLYIEEDFEYLDICGVDGVTSPCSTGPVLQVIYVTISNVDHPKEFEIYGEISMTDYKRDTFYIYKCEPEEPEFVDEVGTGCNLYLTHCPIVPAMGGKVKFSLTNKDSKVQIFDKECDVKDASEDTKEGTFTLEFYGIDGYHAKMVFTKIPFAVIAKVKMFLRPPRPGENKTSFEVHGEITANKVIVKNHPERQEMERGKLNLFIPYRYVFAASLLSSLDVKVKLYNGNLELADDTYKVATCPETFGMPRTSVFKCKAEDCFFEMDVDWIPHDDFFGDSVDVQLLSDPDVLLPSRPMREKYQPPIPDPVEVFSVSIGGVSAPRDLCGTIVVRDDGGKVYIFARNTNCPDKLSSSNEQQFRTVSLAWPDRWVLEQDLFMHLKLKDVQDRLVCRGNLSWCAGYDGRYDSRLCDIIQSEEGEEGCFVAVHYSVFKNGKKAKLSVQCIDGGPYILYGSVFAQYDNHDYPSPYDEQCYRSTIFRRSSEECLRVDNGSEVRLSKSHVSAPSDCKQLIVVADLWVRHSNMTSFKPVTGELHFEARRYGSQTEDLGGCFLVTVNWS